MDRYKLVGSDFTMEVLVALKPKTRNPLALRTFVGKDRKSYLVFRTADNSFHAFVEIEAKDAARQCGARNKGNTRQMWKSIWGGER